MPGSQRRCCSAVPPATIVGPAQPSAMGLSGRVTPALASSSSMASCSSGPASRPHGAGQCGATQPASASSVGDGSGWAASQARSSSRTRRRRRPTASGATGRARPRSERSGVGRQPERHPAEHLERAGAPPWRAGWPRARRGRPARAGWPGARRCRRPPRTSGRRRWVEARVALVAASRRSRRSAVAERALLRRGPGLARPARARRPGPNATPPRPGPRRPAPPPARPASASSGPAAWPPARSTSSSHGPPGQADRHRADAQRQRGQEREPVERLVDDRGAELRFGPAPLGHHHVARPRSRCSPVARIPMTSHVSSSSTSSRAKNTNGAASPSARGRR